VLYHLSLLRVLLVKTMDSSMVLWPLSISLFPNGGRVGGCLIRFIFPVLYRVSSSQIILIFGQKFCKFLFFWRSSNFHCWLMGSSSFRGLLCSVCWVCACSYSISVLDYWSAVDLPALYIRWRQDNFYKVTYVTTKITSHSLSIWFIVESRLRSTLCQLFVL
jgi:hypothetical protein